VRLDSGFTKGDAIGGNFDSLLAKLIVTGRDRQEALERSRRALAEFEIDGIATALTFHRAVVSDPAFAPADAATPFSVHTRWIETEFNNTIPAFSGGAGELAEPESRNPITVEVNGRRIEVVLPGDMSIGSSGGAKKSARKIGKKSGAAGSGDAVVAPMQGTIVKIAVTEGQEVAQGDLVVVLEAMKMEQPLTAHKAGIVTGLNAEVGTTVPTGTELMEIK
jgi:acetyl-CoA/propionyl-CoA carboxylase biotin carboxyl carrier protein